MPPITRTRWRGATRLIPSRYPSVGLFDRVTTPDDLESVLELESWTNDRISNELGVLHTIPRDEWVVGVANASVIMAAFCHPNPLGTRFSGRSRGVWYAARTLETSIAETAYHRWREFQEIGVSDSRTISRLYRSDLMSSFHDIRRNRAFEDLLDPDDYRASQAFAADLLASGSNGIVYPSVRHAGGECVACFRPRLVQHVRAASHYEFRWSGSPTPDVRPLS